MGVTPFPNAVCEPFTTSNNVAVAVFRQDPVRFNKSHYMTIKMVTGHSKAEATIWNRNRAGEYEDGFCDNIRGTHSNSSSPRMPLVAECVAVKEWAAANAGHWVVSKNDLNKHNRVVLLAVASCAFVVGATEEKRTDTGIIISSKDVTKAMQDVIKKPQIGGRVEGKVVNRDPTCGFIYAFTKPFFEDAICYENKLDSGKWTTSFIDPKAGISKLKQTDSAIFAGDRVK
ncbi:hypothetical protein CH063_00066 [Colletotrichum higginsianum]|uniref:Ecp2 effector protein-like domain-containing protein n=1 Tax=Colletotrichum higginsianum (strain IMI 349063) TaxID=759273 RepID=H1VW34_COLHI|nr:hypothetical protein CH063_00066 [Colletotrichum higginsianum]